MALSKTISTPYGPAAYHVVSGLNFNRVPSLVSTVTIASYVDSRHRHTEGAQPLATWEGSYGAVGGLDPEGPNVIEQAYAWAKTQAAWSDATDA